MAAHLRGASGTEGGGAVRGGLGYGVGGTGGRRTAATVSGWSVGDELLALIGAE